MNIKEVELMIINHYGVMKQLKYFQSEVFELNEAIIQHEKKDPIVSAVESINRIGSKLSGKKYRTTSINHIIEEIADVQFMLNQFKEYYEITDDEILDVILSKANRQLERIEKE